MDQPEHQVFDTDDQSYRYMKYPFKKQPLQLLYPGRLMQQNYHYTGENIPNEDPCGLAETQYQMAALAYAAKLEQEALNRHLGGKDKVLNHLAVEPEAIVDDPSLKLLNLKTDHDHSREGFEHEPKRLPPTHRAVILWIALGVVGILIVMAIIALMIGR